MNMKQTNPTRLLCLCGLLGLMGPAPVMAAPAQLRCEGLENPMAVDTPAPRLSWVMETGKDSPRGLRQNAYRVLVASSPAKLAKDTGDLWDSGKVESDRSIQIAYAGRPLISRQPCHWKVRVWDQDGKPSDWSTPAEWRMGLLKPDDWRGQWITMKTADGLAHPWLRRTFELTAAPKEARIYINTPCHYELYVNGRKVGDDVLSPAHCQIKKRFHYNVRDLSGLLRPGKNCVALWMGPGWFQPRYGNRHKAPIVRAQLEIGSDDGPTVIPTDSAWRVADSCISQVGSWSHNNFGGERWDARRYLDDWNRSDFDDSGWAPAIEIPAPAVDHSWQALPGSRLGSPQPPRHVYQKDGRWVLDFGKNFTGWMRCRFTGLEPGREITIDYADLDPDRRHLMHVPDKTNGFQTFNQKDIYIAGDKTEDVFCSKFNHHGFRYAVISGLSRAPEKNDAAAMMIATDLPKAGGFRCSNELFNRIHETTVRTCLAQIPAGVLGGGETREHLGYGDGGSFLTGFLYNFKSDAFFRKWLRDWRDNQRDDGFLGHVAPEFYPAGGGPSWCGQASELVRRLHLYHGDRRAVEESYVALKRFVEFLEHRTKDDLLAYYNPYKPGTWKKWYYLGDWTPPGTDPDKDQFVFEAREQQDFFNNCYRILLWDQLAVYAEILGDPAEAGRCRQRLAVLRPLVHKTWWDAEKKTYRVNRQAYLAIALLSGIVPAELRPEILRQLEQDIVVTRNGHLDTGLQGTFMLLDLLTRENRPDLAARIMNQTTYPSWGFLLEQRGVTTWPETWSGWGSQIIQVVGTPGAWFYEGLAGIRPDWEHPGFKHFTVRPGVVTEVDWVKCRHVSPHGEIISNWRREGSRLTMDVTVPPNTFATVWVPAANAASVTESGKPAAQADGVDFLRMEDGCAVYQVGSGRYVFTGRMARTGEQNESPR